jgi:hypothetical protein
VAKRKTAGAEKTKSASGKKSNAKSDAGNNQPTGVKTKAKVAGPRALTGIEIGHVAGDVWAALVKEDELTLAALKKAVKAPPDLVAAAIGWLAREDKLEFGSGATPKIGLRRHG